ncbi:MAG: deaminase [Bacteroidales bacterium]
MIVIGITGTLGAGKGTVVEYLRKQHTFSYFSVRDFLTKEIQDRNMVLNRDSMTFVANELRTLHSSSYIVDELYKQALASGSDAIIESIRAIGEVQSLKEKGHFILLAVDADPKWRYERIRLRSSSTDHIDYPTFLANEKREMENMDPNKQNLLACMRMADVHLSNNGNIEELYVSVDKVLQNLPIENSHSTSSTSMFRVKNHRPNWEEYFMELCHSVAKRATCDRGKSGCVIVKDKQILVTGYVGSPSHLPHCDEEGHLFRKILHDDGHISTHCVRTVHAEQNAICQAARRGIALDGSTLYCTMTPCRTCAMLIINCGIKKVICEYKYHSGAESEEMFAIAGIELKYFHTEILQYNQQ